MGKLLMVAIVIIFIFLPVTVISCMMLFGHGNFFISKYNSMTEESNDEEIYDKKAFLRFTGIVLLILEIFLGMIILGALNNVLWMMIVGILLFIAAIVAILLYFNSKDRFKREK